MSAYYNMLKQTRRIERELSQPFTRANEQLIPFKSHNNLYIAIGKLNLFYAQKVCWHDLVAQKTGIDVLFLARIEAAGICLGKKEI